MSNTTSVSTWTRPQVYLLNRSLVLLVFFGTLTTLLWQPVGFWAWFADIALRTYLIFVGCTMAHESGHFHLGPTPRSNRWWGRLSTFPSTVPSLSFRKTHGLHHAHTNVPGEDPDHFLKPNSIWEVPFRSLGLPHWWFLWLLRRGKITRKDWGEIAIHYTAVVIVYGAILSQVGFERVAWGLLPALFFNSVLLWYFFAVRTHDGYLTSSEEEMSHNYYGRFIFWFSLGLSMHRVHHMYPRLAWIECLPYVEERPPGVPWWGFRRQIIRHEQPSVVS